MLHIVRMDTVVMFTIIPIIDQLDMELVVIYHQIQIETVIPGVQAKFVRQIEIFRTLDRFLKIEISRVPDEFLQI